MRSYRGGPAIIIRDFVVDGQGAADMIDKLRALNYSHALSVAAEMIDQLRALDKASATLLEECVVAFKSRSPRRMAEATERAEAWLVREGKNHET